MDETQALIQDLQAVFRNHADAAAAGPMRKYMKDLFPFLGIPKPLRSELEKPWISECKKLPFPKLKKLITALWSADEREYQYTALVLMRAAKIWNDKESLELLEKLVVQKSWWDTVDAIAAQLIGPYFLKFPEKKYEKTKEWKECNNLWLNRTALLFQIKYKDKTDITLLTELILHFMDEKEFFIKKAIGWALRELSYTYPQSVIEFCETYPIQNLSRREALKALQRRGKLN